jgi:CheY-like chemotaxis protein
MATPKTILVADDSEEDQFIFNWALAKSGLNAELHSVLDGVEAVAYLAGEPPFDNRRMHPLPDLIVLDLKMPKMNGFDVLRWMSEHPASPPVPVAVFSSSSEPEDIKKAYALGARAYLVKPHSAQAYDGIIQKLREYLYDRDVYPPTLPRKFPSSVTEPAAHI